MFKMPTRKKTGLEEARDEALSVLNDFDPVANKDQYALALGVVETLSNLIAKESREKMSANTMLMVGGNLAVATIIVGYEQANVITSKAVAFFGKAT